MNRIVSEGWRIRTRGLSATAPSRQPQGWKGHSAQRRRGRRRHHKVSTACLRARDSILALMSPILAEVKRSGEVLIDRWTGRQYSSRELSRLMDQGRMVRGPGCWDVADRKVAE